MFNALTLKKSLHESGAKAAKEKGNTADVDLEGTGLVRAERARRRPPEVEALGEGGSMRKSRRVVPSTSQLGIKKVDATFSEEAEEVDVTSESSKVEAEAAEQMDGADRAERVARAGPAGSATGFCGNPNRERLC